MKLAHPEQKVKMTEMAIISLFLLYFSVFLNVFSHFKLIYDSANTTGQLQVEL